MPAQMVTVREGGVERRVSAEEAFLLFLLKRGLEGDGAATRATLTAIEIAAKRRTILARGAEVVTEPVWWSVT